jgi:hypothetical protein
VITSVVTLSLAQVTHQLGSLRRSGIIEQALREGLEWRGAWIGFETGDGDRSPLPDFEVGPRLVIRCADWDADGRHSPRFVGPAQCLAAPTIEHAREIVRFVLALHGDDKKHRLYVHCQAGLFRSGAVAEWVRTDLGVVEPPTSNRLVDVIGDTSEQRTYNIALLRLLHEAHAAAQ